jgi:plasmid maintenance system antidote protein VapI
MPLDFSRAADLFMGTEQELAKALGISVADVRAARSSSRHVSRDLLLKLGRVLQERGAGMTRVGEILESEGRG